MAALHNSSGARELAPEALGRSLESSGIYSLGPPIVQSGSDGSVAPWPVADHWPIVIGPGLSLAYISSIFRLSLNGYRREYVDLLEEMLEKDPHAYGVLSKRVNGVAGGTLQITPAETPPGSLDAALAQEIATETGQAIANIPDLDEHLAALAWALFYAVEGCEIHWARDGRTFFPDRLSFIHSRRLSYPRMGDWDLYVWDQGPVLPGAEFGQQPTSAGFFGMRIADYPGKFLIHAPQIRGTYPTREGLGRQIAYWLALKLVTSRNAPQYLERFAKPWVEGVYKTKGRDEERVASDRDIADAKVQLAQMGAGSLSWWAHPDTITLNLRTPDQANSKLTYAEWLSICDSQVSKATLGGTLSTEVGSTGGNRSLGDTQKKDETSLKKSDAKRLAASIKRDLVASFVALNWPSAPRRLLPQVTLVVDEAPDPLKVIEKAAKAAAAGMPVDADKTAAEAGVHLIAPGDTKARRMFPIMAVKDPASFDADLAQRAHELAEQYATEPTETPDGETPPNGSPEGEHEEAGDDEHEPAPKDGANEENADEESADS